MGYTNSSLVAFTRLSPNHSGKRTHRIDRISPHCVVGQCTAESLGEWFSAESTVASANYGIDKDGRVGLYVEEKNRSWCTSSNSNDQRAVTIECASDVKEPYWMNERVYDSLIRLCVDICRRNGKKKLLWFGDREKALNYVPAADEMVITVHRWFANKSCPGDWLYARLDDVATKVTALLDGTGTGGPQNTGSDAGSMTDKECPFMVKVSIPDLNIREGAGTDTARTGEYTGVGTFTIVEVRTGEGSENGWGRLKSGMGWIALDYCQKV